MSEIGDAWHPNVAPLDIFRNMISEFRSIPEAKNKQICVRIALNLKATKSEYVSPQGERRLILSGNMQQNKDIISQLERLGVTYVLVAPSPDGKVPIPDQVQSLRMLSEPLTRRSTYIG
jgi:hypothetical protein